jgi:hypothetical protein
LNIETLSALLIDFSNIKRGNIFSSGTTTTTSATVRKRKKREENEKDVEKNKFRR